MPIFSLNLILMLAWVIVTADFTEGNLLQGFIIGWLALWLIHPALGQTKYFRKPAQIASLIIYFLKSFLISSLRVAWDVLTPQEKSHPGIIELPLTVRTETQILMLANLISLTPGTLSLDVSQDNKTLYVHVMFLDDPDEMIKSIKSSFERRIIEVTS